MSGCGKGAQESDLALFCLGDLSQSKKFSKNKPPLREKGFHFLSSHTANICIHFFTLEMQWNITKNTVRNCKFSIIFEFLFMLDKYSNYNISMYFKNTTKKL